MTAIEWFRERVAVFSQLKKDKGSKLLYVSGGKIGGARECSGPNFGI